MECGLEKLIASIRNAHPDMVDLFMFGQCYNLYLIVRSVFPNVKCMYSQMEGHVYISHEGRVYDIRGRRYNVPNDLREMDHKRGDKPHRWGTRDTRRLTEQSKPIELWKFDMTPLEKFERIEAARMVENEMEKARRKAVVDERVTEMLNYILDRDTYFVAGQTDVEEMWKALGMGELLMVGQSHTVSGLTLRRDVIHNYTIRKSKPLTP